MTTRFQVATYSSMLHDYFYLVFRILFSSGIAIVTTI